MAMAGSRLIRTPKVAAGRRRNAAISAVYGIALLNRAITTPPANASGAARSGRTSEASNTTGSETSAATTIARVSPRPSGQYRANRPPGGRLHRRNAR